MSHGHGVEPDKVGGHAVAQRGPEVGRQGGRGLLQDPLPETLAAALLNLPEGLVGEVGNGLLNHELAAQFGLAGDQCGFLQRPGLGERPVSVEVTPVQGGFDAGQPRLRGRDAVVGDGLDGRCLASHLGQPPVVGRARQLPLERVELLLLRGGFRRIKARWWRRSRLRNWNRDRRRGQALPLAQHRERRQDAHDE